MPYKLLFGAALALILTGATRADDKKADTTAPDKKATAGYVHVVVFRMKKDTPKDAVEKVIADCHEMLAKIPSVRMVRAGRPADKGTPELAKKNYDVALLILVDDSDGLKAYLEHPKHLDFVKKHGTHFDMEKLQVFDFMNQMK